MNADIREKGDEEFNKSAGGRIPQERWGKAEDFKGPAVFLASEASAYVNGESLVVSVYCFDILWLARLLIDRHRWMVVFLANRRFSIADQPNDIFFRGYSSHARSVVPM